MSTIVLGAGLAGVTTAYYLARAGEAVTVVDRRRGPGLDTSYANGGLVTVSHAMPWANGKTPKVILRSLGRGDGPMRVALRADPALWRWGLRFLGNCRSGPAQVHGERMIRFAAYSRRLLDELRAAEPELAFDADERGVVQLYPDPATLASGKKLAETLNRLEVPARLLTPDEIAALEPALDGVAGRYLGGLHAPGDLSGDARAFTAALAERAAALGARFLYNTEVQGFAVENGAIRAVRTGGGELSAERFVAAMGSHTPRLLAPLGLRLPVYPVKGHSLTYQVKGVNRAPAMGILDEGRKVAVARLGDRVRVAGMADVVGYDARPDPARVATLAAAVRDLLPEVAESGTPEPWAGLRPMTPDGPPILGRSKRVHNLWLNTGHGSLGWTMACASGRATAALALGEEFDYDLSGLTAERFRAAA